MVNEVAEELEERSLKTAFSPEQATMEDIVDAQEAILIHIPVTYREFLLHTGHLIYGKLEPATVADAHAHNYLPEMAAEAWARGMPREYIPLCEDDGNIYCIGEDDTVYLWRPGSEEVEECFENVWYWVKDIWLER